MDSIIRFQAWQRRYVRGRPLRWVKVGDPAPWPEVTETLIEPGGRDQLFELRFLPLGIVPTFEETKTVIKS